MDDFTVANLHESKNEWSARLLTILTPCIIEGFRSIFNESMKLCKETNEQNKYLMTFQNFITCIPKWNEETIIKECNRIIEKSKCNHLEDLISCVHVIQVKILSVVRVGQKQKKIDINIPSINNFIHKVYINVARKIYTNVYLFETNISPLAFQKNSREIEIIVQECILTTIRDSIPIESILNAYISETEEDTVEIEKKVQMAPEIESNSPEIEIENVEKNPSLTFNDIDYVSNENKQVEKVVVPKTIENLEKISELRNLKRKEDEDEDEEEGEGEGEDEREDNEKITISSESIPAPTNIQVLDEEVKIKETPLLTMPIEVLD